MNNFVFNCKKYLNTEINHTIKVLLNCCLVAEKISFSLFFSLLDFI